MIKASDKRYRQIKIFPKDEYQTLSSANIEKIKEKLKSYDLRYLSFCSNDIDFGFCICFQILEDRNTDQNIENIIRFINNLEDVNALKVSIIKFRYVVIHLINEYYCFSDEDVENIRKKLSAEGIRCSDYVVSDRRIFFTILENRNTDDIVQNVICFVDKLKLVGVWEGYNYDD